MTIIVTLSNPSSLVEIAGAVVVVAAVFFALRFIFPGMYISLHRFSATPSPSRVYCQRKMIFCWNSVWQKEKTKYYFLNGNLFFLLPFFAVFHHFIYSTCTMWYERRGVGPDTTTLLNADITIMLPCRVPFSRWKIFSVRFVQSDIRNIYSIRLITFTIISLIFHNET